MNFCPKCGQQLAEDTKFCPKCGITVQEQQPAEQPPAEQEPQNIPAPMSVEQVAQPASIRANITEINPILPHTVKQYPMLEGETKAEYIAWQKPLLKAWKKNHKLAWAGFWVAAIAVILVLFVGIPTLGNGPTAPTGGAASNFRGIGQEDPYWVGYCDIMAWAIYGDSDNHGNGEQWESGVKLAKSDLIVGYSTFRSDYRTIRISAQMLLEYPPEQVERNEANTLWQKYYMGTEVPPEETLPDLEPALLEFAYTIAVNVNDIPAEPDYDSLKEYIMSVGRKGVVVGDKTGKYWAVNDEVKTILPYAYFIGKPDSQKERENTHLYFFADSYDESGNLLYKASDGSLQPSAMVAIMMGVMQVEEKPTTAPIVTPNKAGFDKWDFVVCAVDSLEIGGYEYFGVSDMVPYFFPDMLLNIEFGEESDTIYTYNPDGTAFTGRIINGEYDAWSKGAYVRWDNGPDWQTAQNLPGFDYN